MAALDVALASSPNAGHWIKSVDIAIAAGEWVNPARQREFFWTMAADSPLGRACLELIAKADAMMAGAPGFELERTSVAAVYVAVTHTLMAWVFG